MYYDKNGEPVSSARWCELLEDLAYRKIERTEMPGGGFVSTVWLGLDHGHGEGPPLIFESMDFPANEHCRRYSTIEDARAGHLDLVAELSPRN